MHVYIHLNCILLKKIRTQTCLNYNVKLKLQLKQTLSNVSLSSGLHTCLVESISNYVCQEEM